MSISMRKRTPLTVIKELGVETGVAVVDEGEVVEPPEAEVVMLPKALDIPVPVGDPEVDEVPLKTVEVVDAVARVSTRAKSVPGEEASLPSVMLE
jgi:hypothetical protein